MERWLERFSGWTYAALRVVFGCLFACHGAQKLFGAFGGQVQTGSPLMLVAGIIEFFGGLLVALGLRAGWAAFLCSGEMASGYFMVHAPNGLLPILNKGEPAVLYSFAFLYIASRGSKAFSLDAALRRRRPDASCV
jgi:putative oxidoreductase